MDPSVFKTIKSICPLTLDDCNNLHLIAVTQCGVRLFFSTTPLNVANQYQNQNVQTNMQVQMITNTTNAVCGNPTANCATGSLPPHHDALKPNGLYLLHVRLPPGYTPNTTINKPKQVHSALYNDGTLLLVSTPQQDQDVLWSISSAPFPNRPYLTESTTVLPLDGIVWSLSEVRDRCKSKLNSLLRKAQKPKNVVLLTNQGAHIVALLKPVDILQQLLLACHGPHHEAIKAFFQAQSEACTICLLLACSEQYRGTDLAMWAAQAFMLYGGEPTFQSALAMGPAAGNSRHNLNNSLTSAQQERFGPQMFMSTPMPVANATSPICRSLQTPQTAMQQTHFPLSPSKLFA